jgi:hypothetical protein
LAYGIIIFVAVPLNKVDLKQHNYILGSLICKKCKEKSFLQTHPPITKATIFFCTFSTTCFNPELGPLQVFFTTELSQHKMSSKNFWKLGTCLWVLEILLTIKFTVKIIK